MYPWSYQPKFCHLSLSLLASNCLLRPPFIYLFIYLFIFGIFWEIFYFFQRVWMGTATLALVLVACNCLVNPVNEGRDSREHRGLLDGVAAKGRNEASHTMDLPGAICCRAVEGSSRVTLEQAESSGGWSLVWAPRNWFWLWGAREILIWADFSRPPFAPLWWVRACMLSCFSRGQFFVTLRTVAHQAPLCKGFSRQEYQSGLPFPSPGDLPHDPLLKRTN